MSTGVAFAIEACRSAEAPGWFELRSALWPDCGPAEHRDEMAAQVAQPSRWIQLIARGADGEALGLAEASLRTDPVNGASGSPVPFLEGLFVVPSARRQGMAAALVDAVARWALAQGCCELASDAPLDNALSHAVHRALGFDETERVVSFRKPLQ